jgi:hypothetical protein
MRMARGTRDDLSQKLTETLYWIDLRTMLVTMLRDKADGGEEKARKQLDFINQFWQGQVPRQHEHGLLEQLVRNLGDLLVRALEKLSEEGQFSQTLCMEALHHGVTLPSTLLEKLSDR